MTTPESSNYLQRAEIDWSGPLAFLTMYLLPIGGSSAVAWYVLSSPDIEIPGEWWQHIGGAALFIVAVWFASVLMHSRGVAH